MSDTLIGVTTRPVTLTNPEAPSRPGPQVRSIPAGTEVYCTPLRRGLRIRIPGTLFTQDVDVDTIKVP